MGSRVALRLRVRVWMGILCSMKRLAVRKFSQCQVGEKRVRMRGKTHLLLLIFWVRMHDFQAEWIDF